MKLPRLHLLVLCLYSALPHSASSLAGSNALPVDDVVSMRTFLRGSTIDLSPDGEWVAYTIDGAREEQVTAPAVDLKRLRTEPQQCSGCYVSVTSLKTGETKTLTDGRGSTWGPVWSANGVRLAYYSNLAGHQQVCFWEKTTEKSTCVGDIETSAASYAYTPQWTVAGDKILTRVVPVRKNISDPKAAGGTTSAPVRGTNEDGATVTVYRSFPETGNAPREASPMDSMSPGSLQSTLAFVDVKTGGVEILSQAQNPIWYSLSPSGAYIAYTVWKRNDNPNSFQPVFDLLVLDLASNHVHIVASNIKTYGSSVSWSPDSKSLAFTTTEVMPPKSLKPNSLEGECFVVSVSGEHLRRVTKGTHPSFAGEFSAPLWDTNGEAIYLLPLPNLHPSWEAPTPLDSIWMVTVPNGRSTELTNIPGRRVLAILAPRVDGRISSVDGRNGLMLLTLNERTKQAGCFRVNVATGAYATVFEDDRAYTMTPVSDISEDGTTIAVVTQQVNRSPNIWAITNRQQRPAQITNINPGLDHFSYGKSTLIEWHIGGRLMQGAVLFPPDYQKGTRYPLIVCQYPGVAFSSSLNNFGVEVDLVNMHLFATREYVVFVTDSLSGRNTPMMDTPKSILPGIDKLIELGIADPDRLGVMGFSYGGYGVMSLIVQTRRFKAAVARAPGFIDRIAHYGNMWSDGSSIYTSFQESELGGTPWDSRDKYIENSPIYFLDKVQTPLLIIQGTRDRATPELLSDGLFVGLRRLGKDVEYAKYEGEGHAIQGYANQVDQFNRLIIWFDRYLKDIKHPKLLPRASANSHCR